MHNQIWKASFLSVTGMAAIANGNSVGTMADQATIRGNLQTSASNYASFKSATAIPVEKPVIVASALGRRTTGKPTSSIAALKTPLVHVAAVASHAVDPVGQTKEIPLVEHGAGWFVSAPKLASQMAFAPQFEVPAPTYGHVQGGANPERPSNTGMLYSHDSAYVTQISTSEAHQYFERVGLGAREIDEKTVSEFDFGQLERFGRVAPPELPAYVEVVDDARVAGKMIIRPMIRENAPSRAETPSQNTNSEKHNEKSPVDLSLQTGGSAEFE
jgi:hypothetical protein